MKQNRCPCKLKVICRLQKVLCELEVPKGFIGWGYLLTWPINVIPHFQFSQLPSAFCKLPMISQVVELLSSFSVVRCIQGRSQYEARRGNCLVLFSSATNFCTFVPR